VFVLEGGWEALKNNEPNTSAQRPTLNVEVTGARISNINPEQQTSFGELSILPPPPFSFTPERSRHLIRFSSPATSIITKFCRGPSVSRWRFIFRGWNFSVRSGLCFVFISWRAIDLNVVHPDLHARDDCSKSSRLDITCGCFGHASQHWSFPAHLATNLAFFGAAGAFFPHVRKRGIRQQYSHTYSESVAF